jgi:FkbM family methyltransferase
MFRFKKNKRTELVHEIYRTLIPGDLHFDIGAHLGAKSKHLIGTGVKVILVEPQPDLAEKLSRSFAVDGNVVIQAGIGAINGILDMSVSTGSPALSTFTDKWKSGRFLEHQWDRTIQVNMLTLDSLIRDYGEPRYVKVDVEGFETRVFEGLSKKTGVLSFEFASELLSDTEICIGRLLDLGYSCFNVSFYENRYFELPKWADSATVLATIRQKMNSDHLLWGDLYAN